MRFRVMAALAALSAVASADAATKDDALVAIARLELEGNYSWQVGSSGATVIDGQTECTGYTVIQTTPPGGSGAIVRHGSQRVTETSYGWLSPKQLRKRRLPDSMGSLVTPVQELQDIVEFCAGFSVAGNVFTGVFGSELAEKLWDANVALARVPTSGSKVYIIPDVTYGPPSGRVKISLSHGLITGYELHIERTMVAGCFSGPKQVSLVVTTTIHHVGSTTVNVPPAAKEALDKLEKS